MQTEKSLSGLKSIIELLEVKLNEINETRQIINKIKSLEDFYAFRLKISQSFFELDQEIRETIQSIRDLQLQFKELASEKEFGDQRYKNLEDKYLNNIKYNEELKKNNRELVFQINVQQEEIVKNENLVASLTNKLNKMDESSDKKENSTCNSKSELPMGKMNNSTSYSLNVKNNISNNADNSGSDFFVRTIKENNERLDSNDKTTYKNLLIQREKSKKILDAILAKSIKEDEVQLVSSRRDPKINNPEAIREGADSKKNFDLPKSNRNLNYKINNNEEKTEPVERNSIEESEKEQHFKNFKSLDNQVVENLKKTPNKQFKEMKCKQNNISINSENYYEGALISSLTKNKYDESPMKNTNLTTNCRSRSKPDRVYNIIMKIKTCPDASVIVPQLFGDSIIEKITSAEVDLELINEIENVILEIDEIKAKGGNNTIQEKEENSCFNENNAHKQLSLDENFNKEDYGNNNLYIENENLSINNHNKYNSLQLKKTGVDVRTRFNNEEQEDRIIPMNHSSNKLFNWNKHTDFNIQQSLNLTKNSNDFMIANTLPHNRTKSNRSLNKSFSKVSKNVSVDFKKESWDNPKFEGMLREYGNKTSKIFNNYCRKASGFFDAPLQKGGASKLKYDFIMRSKSTNKILNKSAERNVYDRSFVSNKSLNYQNYLHN